MKIFLDSNILLSAVIRPTGRVGTLYDHLTASEHSLVTSDYVLNEVRRVTARKRPLSVGAVESFIAIWHHDAMTVSTPTVPEREEALVRDENDRPILRAARAAQADVLLTGDNDLLSAEIARPRILNPAALWLELGLG